MSREMARHASQPTYPCYSPPPSTHSSHDHRPRSHHTCYTPYLPAWSAPLVYLGVLQAMWVAQGGTSEVYEECHRSNRALIFISNIVSFTTVVIFTRIVITSLLPFLLNALLCCSSCKERRLSKARIQEVFKNEEVSGWELYFSKIKILHFCTKAATSYYFLTLLNLFKNIITSYCFQCLVLVCRLSKHT